MYFIGWLLGRFLYLHGRILEEGSVFCYLVLSSAELITLVSYRSLWGKIDSTRLRE